MDVTKHLDDFHGDRCERLVNEGHNVWLANLTDEERNFEQRDRSSFWTVGQVTSTCGSVFFLEAWMKDNAIHCWIKFLGSLDDAMNYSVNFSVKSGEVNYDQYTRTYFGDPHSDFLKIFVQISSRYTFSD